MLNLSDNELDRLSREAASQHDPGDLLGPQAWEKLQVRLDKELGRAGPDPSRGLRGIRRLPFQYAPVILLIVGVSYYFVKQSKGRRAENSGSPPPTVVKTPQQPGTTTSDSSLKNSVYSDKSTSTPYPTDQSQNTDRVASATTSATTSGSASTPSGSPTPSSGSTPPSSGSTIPSGTTSATTRSTTSSPGVTSPRSGSSVIPGSSTRPGSTTSSPKDLTRSSHTRPGRNTPGARTNSPRHRNGQDQAAPDRDNLLTSNNNPTANRNIPTAGEAGPERAFIQRPFSLRGRNRPISDSALRAYAAQTPTNPDKKSGPSLKINRSLTIGFQVAPDFSSVNALAGDRAGSTFGLTIDYQVANRLHIGSGLLYTRKNYTARTTDYHVGDDYYHMVSPKPIDFVKGSMTMLEVPLNVRYDFSVAGNTLFFASGGLSTYLFGSEHTNYYFEAFGREVCRGFRYSNNPGFFSAASISLGVETGISNDFSLLVAPYMKAPLSGIGFGKVNVSSVGINIGIRYSPVISRKRKH